MSAAIHRPTSPDFAASPLSWIYRFIFSRSIFVLLTSGYDYIYEDTTYLMKSQPLHERLLHHIETGNIESAMRAAKLLWKDVNIEKESDEEHFN